MWIGRRQHVVGTITAAMVLLATTYCACASAMTAHHPSAPAPMPASNHEMPCCQPQSAGQNGPCAPAQKSSHPDCQHCQQSMTPSNAPAPDLTPGFHAWAMDWRPVLFDWIQLEPPTADRRLDELPSCLSSRQLLRLHCALLI